MGWRATAHVAVCLAAAASATVSFGTFATVTGHQPLDIAVSSLTLEVIQFNDVAVIGRAGEPVPAAGENWATAVFNVSCARGGCTSKRPITLIEKLYSADSAVRMRQINDNKTAKCAALAYEPARIVVADVREGYMEPPPADPIRRWSESGSAVGGFAVSNNKIFLALQNRQSLYTFSVDTATCKLQLPAFTGPPMDYLAPAANDCWPLDVVKVEAHVVVLTRCGPRQTASRVVVYNPNDATAGSGVAVTMIFFHADERVRSIRTLKWDNMNHVVVVVTTHTLFFLTGTLPNLSLFSRVDILGVRSVVALRRAVGIVYACSDAGLSRIDATDLSNPSVTETVGGDFAPCLSAQMTASKLHMVHGENTQYTIVGSLEKQTPSPTPSPQTLAPPTSSPATSAPPTPSPTTSAPTTSSPPTLAPPTAVPPSDPHTASVTPAALTTTTSVGGGTTQTPVPEAATTASTSVTSPTPAPMTWEEALDLQKGSISPVACVAVLAGVFVVVGLTSLLVRGRRKGTDFGSFGAVRESVQFYTQGAPPVSRKLVEMQQAGAVEGLGDIVAPWHGIAEECEERGLAGLDSAPSQTPDGITPKPSSHFQGLLPGKSCSGSRHNPSLLESLLPSAADLHPLPPPEVHHGEATVGITPLEDPTTDSPSTPPGLNSTRTLNIPVSAFPALALGKSHGARPPMDWQESL
eukprot:TRINITY_DN18467_c0_g1_i1.p1 TRINITY_DN18467_c0_g1~~TRINITY_DN18467_c0_g1_i1.p1  ORF type:complete len:693 (+),score=36.15 TRINITY_DN18467_c0_g1_i1:61-2139(+)